MRNFLHELTRLILEEWHGETAPLCHTDTGRAWYSVDNQAAQSSFQLYRDCLSVFFTVQLCSLFLSGRVSRSTGLLAPAWKPPCNNVYHSHWTRATGIGLERWHVGMCRKVRPPLASLRTCACMFLCDCVFVLVGLLMGVKRVQVVWSTGSEGLSGVGRHGPPWSFSKR